MKKTEFLVNVVSGKSGYHLENHVSTTKTYSAKAYAKVNLILLVGGPRREDGMHPICSWMHSIDLCDTIEIHRLPESQESSYSIIWDDGRSVDWAIEDDLAARAHQLMEREVGRLLPIRLRVCKSIPAGGGLGGGSADAGAVIVGLNAVFELGLSLDRLELLGSLLGSDVPFFIDPGFPFARSALVSGLGDQVERLVDLGIEPAIANQPITLVIPPFGCHTGKVYRAFDELRANKLDRGDQRSRVLGTIHANLIHDSALINELAAASVVVEPRLGTIQRQLSQQLNMPIHVSGSGSTLVMIGHLDDQGCHVVREICDECVLVSTTLL